MFVVKRSIPRYATLVELSSGRKLHPSYKGNAHSYEISLGHSEELGRWRSNFIEMHAQRVTEPVFREGQIQRSVTAIDSTVKACKALTLELLKEACVTDPVALELVDLAFARATRAGK
jgi:hypothetical protein